MIFKSPIKRKSSTLSKFKKDESGAIFVEYSLLVGLIALGSVVAIAAFSGKIDTAFNSIGTSLDNKVKVQ